MLVLWILVRVGVAVLWVFKELTRMHESIRNSTYTVELILSTGIARKHDISILEVVSHFLVSSLLV